MARIKQRGAGRRPFRDIWEAAQVARLRSARSAPTPPAEECARPFSLVGSRHFDFHSREIGIGIREPLPDIQHFKADGSSARVEIKNDAVADFF